MTGQRSELRIPVGSLGPALARAAVPKLLPPLPATLVADLQLLVSELVSDAVARSPGPGAADVRVVVATVGGHIRVEVAAAGGTPGPLDDGWGRLLLDRLTSGWGYDEEQYPPRVWFEVAAA